MATERIFSADVIKLGDQFELDLGAYELRRAGQSIRMGRIPMELLLLLVEHRGQLVTREQIVEKIWGKDVFLDTDNSINAAIRKIRQVLQDDPEKPAFIQTVIGRGYRFVAAVEIPEVESEIEQAPQLAVRPRSLSVIWGLTGLIFLIVLAGFTFGGVRERFTHRASRIAPASTARQSVAVLGFQNLSRKEDDAWVSTALSELVSADLGAGQKLRLIAGENVAHMKNDLNLPPADSYSPETLSKIRQHLGSDLVVLGSYLVSTEKQIHLTLKVQDARTGEIVAVVSDDGKEADLAHLVSHTGSTARQILNLKDTSTEDMAETRAAIPGNPEAARFYAEGLAKLRNFELLPARDLLVKAIALDPDHALSHTALSECWATLGYDSKAQDEAKAALELSSRLPREQQLSIEARYRVVTHDWPRAIQVYQMLWEFFPDNLDYGLALVKAQWSGATGKDAMATIEALKKMPAPASADPRIDLAEAMAADRSGDLQREEQAAARAVEKGRQNGARSMIAGGLLTRGSALSALGDNASAITTLQQAKTIFSDIGDKQGEARALNNLGIIARHQANFAEAQRLLEQSLEISREIGSQLSIRQALNNLANVVWQRGDTAKALAYHQQALQLSRNLGDKAREAISLNNIAGLLILQGRLQQTLHTYEESLQLSNEIGDRESVGLAQANLADTLTRMGNLDRAKEQAEAALAVEQRAGSKSLQGYALCDLGTILVAQGNFETARARYQECSALRHDLGEKINEAESQLGLAQIRLDSGDAKGSEEEARRIAKVVHGDGPTDDEALSYSLLAESLLVEGKWPEARQASAKAIELLEKSLDLATKLQVEIVDAYVKGISEAGANSNLAEAMRSLEVARAKAKLYGYDGLEFEARLRIAQLEIHSGNLSSARVQMEQLRKDAQAHGFLSVARKASNALQSRSFSQAIRAKNS